MRNVVMAVIIAAGLGLGGCSTTTGRANGGSTPTQTTAPDLAQFQAMAQAAGSAAVTIWVATEHPTDAQIAEARQYAAMGKFAPGVLSNGFNAFATANPQWQQLSTGSAQLATSFLAGVLAALPAPVTPVLPPAAPVIPAQ